MVASYSCLDELKQLQFSLVWHQLSVLYCIYMEWRLKCGKVMNWVDAVSWQWLMIKYMYRWTIEPLSGDLCSQAKPFLGVALVAALDSYQRRGERRSGWLDRVLVTQRPRARVNLEVYKVDLMAWLVNFAVLPVISFTIAECNREVFDF